MPPPTKPSLFARVSGLFGGGVVDDALLDSLYEQLLLADVGVDATSRIIDRLKRDSRTTPEQVLESLRTELLSILSPCELPLHINSAPTPFVIMMVGVNGTGKTTTLAKLAARFCADGNNVMLAACDTFRAAAIEQLQTWGEQLQVPVIAQAHGSDAAAVAYDAYSAACARSIDVLLIDTAGRQHTHGDLMEQLKKIVRVLQKVNPAVPNEILLSVDAGTGNNALSQAEHFHAAVGLNGICATKLDGTAKGGVVVALAERFQLPIRFLGMGQQAEDLKPFCANDFVAELLPQTTQ